MIFVYLFLTSLCLTGSRCIHLTATNSFIFMADITWASDGSHGKASVYNAGDPGSIPGSGKSPGEGNGNPLQHSCLENPMDGGA